MASTWGEPEISNSSPMQGPAQINAAAEFAMRAGVRHFATQSAMIAATGKEEGFLAVVEAIPGALFRWDVSDNAWQMFGVPQFDNEAARDAAFSSIPAGAEVKCTDTGIVFRRVGSNWVKWHKAVTAWTPVFAGLTVGASVRTGFYSISHGMVEGGFTYLAGAGAAATTSTVPVTLPETRAAAAGAAFPLGEVLFRDSSALSQWGGEFLGQLSDQDSAWIVMPQQNAAYAQNDIGRWTNFGTATPGGWAWAASGDFFNARFRYPIVNSI